jgi:hypothetical protein
MKHVFLLLCSIGISAALLPCHAQKKSYNLKRLLKERKIITHDRNAVPLPDGDRDGISMTGIGWLKDVTFSSGTIEIDLRGKDVMQRSFIGIAFHGSDTTTFDVVYFRPFNFNATDPVRKIHAVQYVSEPDFPWHKLREEKNGVYEKGIDPPPSATDWFHASIMVGEKEIKVFVNHATEPSLTVPKLNDRKDGLIGLFNEGLNGDFANLVLQTQQ